MNTVHRNVKTKESNFIDLSKYDNVITEADLEALDYLLTWNIREITDSLMFVFFRYLIVNPELHAEDVKRYSSGIEFLIETLIKLERGGRI